jgi:hypothetical protein
LIARAIKNGKASGLGVDVAKAVGATGAVGLPLATGMAVGAGRGLKVPALSGPLALGSTVATHAVANNIDEATCTRIDARRPFTARKV